MDNENEAQAAHLPTFTYYVGEVAYQTHLPAMTGAQIKARIPGLSPDDVLTLEDSDDTKPDRVIGDAHVVIIAGHKRHFTVAPPATFGDAIGPVARQLQRLAELAPGVQAESVPGIGTLISLPTVTLPAGWSKTQTAVWFVLQGNYPYAQPDCFYADADLRLMGGQLPQNAQMQAVPILNQERLWFSWHVAKWDAATNDLVTWLAVIRNRLGEAC